jgi:hypothetical protein
MQSTPILEQSWFKPTAVFVLIALLSLSALTLMGTQVSGILSTVGASVGGYPYPQNGSDGDTGDETSGDSGAAGSDSGGSGSGGVVTAIPSDGLLIIKTGTLALEVGTIDKAVSAATAAIDGLGGYASGSQQSGSGVETQATITFRVPAARWDEAMNAARGLAIEVLSEESTTQDVTSQVVDLGARIRNLQATEAALQSIMDRATVIKDVLAVQAELTTVRGEIEQRSAEKAHLEAQAAYSTLTVTFALKPAPVLVEQQEGFDPASEVDAASASLVGVLQGVATAGIWFGIVWLPILLTLGMLTAIGWLVVRRVRRLAPEAPVGN